MGTKLNMRRERFAREYALDGNGKRAANAAGYSPKSAESTASTLLRNNKVSQAIASERERLAKRSRLSGDDVLRALERIAEADIAEAFNADGTLRNIHDIPRDLRLALGGFEVTELAEGACMTKKFKLNAREKALELLAKHHGLLLERVEHSGKLRIATVMHPFGDGGPDG